MEHKIADFVIGKLMQDVGIPTDALEHMYDILRDGLAKQSAQELAVLYTMLYPEDSRFIAIKDGRVASLMEAGVTIYRKFETKEF